MLRTLTDTYSCSTVGNISLVRVLPQIYAQNKQPINDNVTTLISLLPKCENTEKTSLLQLLELVAKDSPQVNIMV